MDNRNHRSPGTLDHDGSAAVRIRASKLPGWIGGFPAAYEGVIIAGPEVVKAESSFIIQLFAGELGRRLHDALGLDVNLMFHYQESGYSFAAYPVF